MDKKFFLFLGILLFISISTIGFGSVQSWVKLYEDETLLIVDPSLHCSDIYGSPDTDFCTDATGAGGGGGADVYVNESGDTMTGDLNFSSANIRDADWINATNINATSGAFSYIDKLEITSPGTPPSNTLRLYVEEIRGFSFYKFLDDTGMKREIVRDSMILVKNVRGSTISANRIVYATGSEDNIPTIDLADASNMSEMPAIGVTIESIADGSYGRVMQVGLLENINTNSLTEGNTLYVSDTTPGTPKITAPLTPNLTQEIGTVLVKSATVGAIQIVARGLTGDEHGTAQNIFYIGNATTGNKTLIFNDGTEHLFKWDSTNSRYELDNNLLVTGNITADNVFLPQYIFSHTNATIPVLGVGIWTNITFDQEDTDVKQGISHTFNDATNDTFTIMEDGIYNVDFDLDLEDTSASASDVDVAGRLTFANGTEIIGSVFETDITKQGAEAELSHNFLASCRAGDKFVFQFTASDADVQISTHGTYGDYPESATILMVKIANL